MDVKLSATRPFAPANSEHSISEPARSHLAAADLISDTYTRSIESLARPIFRLQAASAVCGKLNYILIGEFHVGQAGMFVKAATDILLPSGLIPSRAASALT